MKTRIISSLTFLLLVVAAVFLTGPRERRVYAQFIGAAYPPGFFSASSNIAAFQPSITSGQGSLAVTNPASNGIINIAAGSVFCFQGGSDAVGQAQINLVLPSSGTNTYLIVYNCASNLIYAKTAVTGPGSPSPNQPGVPTTILAAIPNVEVPLATVACNSTACGNGGNGTITDNRPAANFSLGHINQPSPNSDTAGTCTAAAATTCTFTFTNAYRAAPACVVTDQTTQTNGALKALPSATNLVITTPASSSDVFSFICFGNSN